MNNLPLSRDAGRPRPSPLRSPRPVPGPPWRRDRPEPAAGGVRAHPPTPPGDRRDCARYQPDHVPPELTDLCLVPIPASNMVMRAESAFGAELTGRLAWRLLTFCDATFDQRSLLSLEPLLARCRRWIRSGSSGRSWAGRVGRTIAAGVGLVRDIRDRCGDPGVALFFKQVSASPPRGRRPTTGRPHLGPVPGQRPDARGGQAVITNDPSSLQDRLLVRETALISGRWTWAGCVTCGTAASACGFRCSSNRSAGSRLRQVGACWTAAPGTSTRHE
jgi:hypothetical protein